MEKDNIITFNKYKDIYDRYKRVPIHFINEINVDEIETLVREMIYDGNVSINYIINELEEKGYYSNEHYEIEDIKIIIGEYI